jgi:hypothetical protein
MDMQANGALSAVGVKEQRAEFYRRISAIT